MKPDSYFEVYAEEAFKAHEQTIEGDAFKGVLTNWDNVCKNYPIIHQAWINAVRKVFEVLYVRDDATGELYATEGVFNQVDESKGDS